MKVMVFLLAFLVSSSATAISPFKAEQFKDFSSLGGTSTTWVNELGSVMTIDVDLYGVVSGYFVNNSPGTGCRGLPYDLRGRATGATIAFAVVWVNGVANCNSATAWAGYAQKGEDGAMQIVTQWSLASVDDAAGQMEAGSHLFTYQSPSAQQSLLGK